MTEKDTYNEDVERLAEGIREFLEDIDLGYNAKYEALRIVKLDFYHALTAKSKSTYVGNPYTIGRRGIVY
tara:strand:+ start:1920 stop:2129 length:210 start_codon:yes stop_codon:yes gene_type:complete